MCTVDSLQRPPIAFAHRGARAHAPENTLDAFKLARKLGATGLESDVWVTADGEVVLDHDGVVRGRARRRSIRDTNRSSLPSHIPTLAELYAQMKDQAPTVDLAALWRELGVAGTTRRDDAPLAALRRAITDAEPPR